MGANDGLDDVEAFVDALYETVRPALAPTPLYEITDDVSVDVSYLGGSGSLPSQDSTEISVLDISIASMFFDDFHVLYEGGTGAGKTYGTETLFDTVFGEDGFYSLQMRDDMLGASPTDPFTTVDQDNGMPKVRIDHDTTDQYGGMFIDELNRARDTNDVMQVVSGDIKINGDRAELGLPIDGTERKKGMAIIAAMNPATAEYSDVRHLDLAGESRWVKFDFPDNAPESGAGQVSRHRSADMHERFWDAVTDRTGHDGDWHKIYPQITDPQRVERPLGGHNTEFIDAALEVVGRDPVERFERNTDLIKNSGYTPHFEVDAGDNYIEKVQEAQGRMRHGFGRRDIEQVEDTSQLLGFITGMKSEDFDITPSLTDVVAATGIVSEGKTVPGTEYGQLVGIVDDVRAAYSTVRDDIEDAVEGTVPDSHGIRETIWQAAIEDGYDTGFDGYQDTLRDKLVLLNEHQDNVVENAVRGRLMADLVVLDSFSEQYEEELTPVFESSQGYKDALYGFAETVQQADNSMRSHRGVYDRLSFCRGGYDGH